MNKVEQSCSNIPSSGIKLFGATITSIQNSSEAPKRDDPTADKKPDKIIQCPRCKSMETKFCYFNNYNVNQPRHFCKGCQRYWTAGGALRNVPVGAGRRKTKPPPRPDGYLFDASTVMQLDYLQEWQAGGFEIEDVFPAKRRRFAFDC